MRQTVWSDQQKDKDFPDCQEGAPTGYRTVPPLIDEHQLLKIKINIRKYNRQTRHCC